MNVPTLAGWHCTSMKIMQVIGDRILYKKMFKCSKAHVISKRKRKAYRKLKTSKQKIKWERKEMSISTLRG